MSDNRKVAHNLLQDANRTVMKDRPGVHGSAENSFEMIADYWNVHIRHVLRVRYGIREIPLTVLVASDVAQMMSTMKKARSIYGDPTNGDNFVDDIGYVSLAGMLQLPDPDANAYKGEGQEKVDPATPPPAAKMKGEPEPIPADAYRHELMFFDGRGNGLGQEFHDKWIARIDEFPNIRDAQENR